MCDINLAEIKDAICEDYCKYLDEAYCQFKDPDEANEWLLEHYCAYCPLGRI